VSVSAGYNSGYVKTLACDADYSHYIPEIQPPSWLSLYPDFINRPSSPQALSTQQAETKISATIYVTLESSLTFICRVLKVQHLLLFYQQKWQIRDFTETEERTTYQPSMKFILEAVSKMARKKSWQAGNLVACFHSTLPQTSTLEEERLHKKSTRMNVHVNQ
jgi:hypothetical protein